MAEDREARYAGMEMREMMRRPVSVANAIPIGVPLNREEVERQLARRQDALKSAGIGPTRQEKARRQAEAEHPWEVGLGTGSVLWEAGSKATRHLLCAGARENLETFRDVLLAHVRAHPRAHDGYWEAAVLDTDERQVWALRRDIREEAEATRLLLIVENPQTQEALSLLAEFAKARLSPYGRQVHLAVFTEIPATIPNELMRSLGARVAFASVSRSDSRDMVGDESAATLPWAEGFAGAAVLYEEMRAFDPQYGDYRIDLPGRRYGRRRDVYVGAPVGAPVGGAGGDGEGE